MNTLAPIVLFVYNRPLHTKQVLLALKQNELADKSVLYIFSDGSKDKDNMDELEKINETRKLIQTEKWCKEIIIRISNENKGLARSIISGVSEVVNKHGKVIVLEDDIVTSPGFLTYMNDALDLYQNEHTIMSISGYMVPHNKKLPETFLFGAPYPWGWATWKHSWHFFKNDADYYYQKFDKEKKWGSFNKLGGKLLQKQLKANINGLINTWYVKWHASIFEQNGLVLYPGKSLTNNIGFDNSGSHCTEMTKNINSSLLQTVNVEPRQLKEHKLAKRVIIKFHQGKFYYLKKPFFKYTPEFIKNLIRRKK